MPEEEMQYIILHCHDSPYGGSAIVDKTTAKILQAGFFWPTLFKDVNAYIRACDRYQRTRNLTRQNEVPLNYILEVEVFDVWGIDFMGSIPSSRGNKYILAVDYIFEWVVAIASPTNDA